MGCVFNFYFFNKIKGFAELRFRPTLRSIGQSEIKKNIKRVLRNIPPRKQFSEMAESIMGRMEYVVIKDERHVEHVLACFINLLSFYQYSFNHLFFSFPLFALPCKTVCTPFLDTCTQLPRRPTVAPRRPLTSHFSPHNIYCCWTSLKLFFGFSFANLFLRESLDITISVENTECSCLFCIGRMMVLL